MRSQIHFLELVYPPISNQEADWFWEDPEVRAEVAQSKLYMIGQRHEVMYDCYRGDEATYSINFDLVSGTQRLSNIVFPLEPNGITGDVELELGDKLIRIWRAGERGKPNSLLGTPVGSVLVVHTFGQQASELRCA